MYTIAVCDDELRIAKYIADTVRNYFLEQNIPVVVDFYDEPEHLRAEIEKNHNYDVILMDIDMPGKNGIELCKEYRQHGGDALVVFVSNKEELVFQTFDVQPFRFVRKRRFREEIGQLCNALIVELSKRVDLKLRFDNELDGTVLSVSIQRLIYVEARGKYCFLRTSEREEELRIRFQDMCDKLQPYSFIQTHRSYLVNPNYIYRIDKESLILDGGEVLPISRRRRNQIREEYFKWSRSEG